MNKLLIMVFAVCLISVHGFVRREAPATAAASSPSKLDDLQKQFEQYADNAGNTLKELFDSEQLKKTFNDAVTGVQKTLDELKKKAESQKTE